MAEVEKNISAHTRANKVSRSTKNDGSWLLAAVIIAVVALFGSPVHLECERAEIHGQVNCAKQMRLVWIIPLPAERVLDVRGAHVASIPGDVDTCDPCYRVELETGRGSIPLRDGYTNVNHDMELVVDKVNTFVHGETLGTMQINEPGMLSLDTLFIFVVWLFLVTAGGLAWEKVKSMFEMVSGSSAKS